jgi:hypothetical protein
MNKLEWALVFEPEKQQKSKIPNLQTKQLCILHYAHAAQPTQLRRYRASEPIRAQIQDPEVPQRAQLFRDCAKEQVVIQIPTRKRINSGKQNS